MPPDQALPRDLWSWDVDVEVADLSTFARLAQVGLDIPEPGRHTWPPFQAIGDQLYREGWRGLVAPSAARPDHLVLCLFWDNDDIAGAQPKPPPILVDKAPVPPTGMKT